MESDSGAQGVADPGGGAAPDVVRVLADGPSGLTELVRLGDGTLCVRKRVPGALDNADAWLALRGVSDPSLPHVRSIEVMPGSLATTCDYVEGETVAERVGAAGRLGLAEAVRIARGVCHAAGVLHSHGIVHRDIVPKNVVIDGDGGVHLIDLGIARVHVDGAKRDTRQLGTWGFAAPEQFGFAQTDARSDIYSIGRLLGYLLTGITPDKEAFAAALADDGIVSPAARAIIERACAFEPSARFQSADELDRALAELVDGPAAGGAPVDPARSTMAPPTHVRGISQGRRWAAGILGAFAVLSTLVMVYATQYAMRLYTGGWVVVVCLFAAVITLFLLLAPLREIIRALLGRGAYEAGEHVVRAVLLAVLKWFLVGAFSLAIVLIVAITVLGPTPTTI